MFKDCANFEAAISNLYSAGKAFMVARHINK